MQNDQDIREHRYCTSEELVEKLKDKGLIIINKKELIDYFDTFNYQNIINKYNSCFLVSTHYWRYLDNANSQMLLDFFNFNISLSVLIAPALRKIESTLSTCVAKVLMEKIDLLHSSRTIFACLSKQEKYSFFKYDLEHNDNKKIDQLFSELQTNFSELRKGEQSLNKNWLEWEEVPLYSLVLVYPFGVNVDLFCNLKLEIQKQILKRAFPQIENISIITFEALLYYFCYLRNKICHSKPIYDFKFDFRKLIHKLKKFNSFSNSKILNTTQNDFLKLFDTHNLSQNNLKLLDMLKMLAKIVDDSLLGGKILQLIKWLEQSVKNGINHEGSVNEKYLPCKKAWENICLVLGYKNNKFNKE